MPFLRFTRDKRGYENTFVMQTGRVQGRKRTRVLYWFRTPPGVRVGRAALDEEAIRTIEAAHPEIQFDWTTILQRRVVRDESPARPRGGPGAPPRERKREGRAPVASPPRAAEPAREIEATAPQVPETHVEPLVEAELRDEAGESSEPEARPVPIIERHPALEELVGSEGVARLRARYAELRARIAEQPNADALRAEAEPLDPDSWVTLDEARHGLEHFEAGFEAIRKRLPLRNRRRRRGRRSNLPESGTTAPNAPESGAVEPDTDEDRGPSGDV